jgi:hypothetical protein
MDEGMTSDMENDKRRLWNILKKVEKDESYLHLLMLLLLGMADMSMVSEALVGSVG